MKYFVNMNYLVTIKVTTEKYFLTIRINYWITRLSCTFRPYSVIIPAGAGISGIFHRNGGPGQEEFCLAVPSNWPNSSGFIQEYFLCRKRYQVLSKWKVCRTWMGLMMYPNFVLLLHLQRYKVNRNDFNISLNCFFI